MDELDQVILSSDSSSSDNYSDNVSVIYKIFEKCILFTSKLLLRWNQNTKQILQIFYKGHGQFLLSSWMRYRVGTSRPFCVG